MTKEQALELVRKVEKKWNDLGFDSDRAWTDIAVEAVMRAVRAEKRKAKKK